MTNHRPHRAHERVAIVMAKAPRPGRSKTRLCPPCTPTQAAALASAALADTLQSVASSVASRKVLVLDGPPGPWLPDGFEVVPQRGRGLDERLTFAFKDVFGGQVGASPALLVGMDTPQLTPALLADAFTELDAPSRTAVLGMAQDGGWWAIGLHRPDPLAFVGVPMSTDQTGACQLERLRSRGHVVGTLPELRDVDYWSDARAVAELIPGSRFACLVSQLAAHRAA